MENTNTRRGLRIGMVVIAIAALLLCSTFVTGFGAGGIAVAQGEVELQLQPEPVMGDDDVPVKVVYRGYGFALNADGTGMKTGTGMEFLALPLRVNIIRVRQLEPIRIRELMGQNKSIDEIRGEIMEKACASTYQGYMQFAGTHYKLVNITVNANINTSHAKDSLAVNKLAIDADVMVPVSMSMPMSTLTQDAADAEPEPRGNGNASAEKPYQGQCVGNISLNVLNSEHEKFITIDEGKLTIRERGEDYQYQYQYHVLLRSER